MTFLLPVDGRIAEVEGLTDIVRQDEREHGVLHEVIEGSAGMFV